MSYSKDASARRKVGETVHTLDHQPLTFIRQCVANHDQLSLEYSVHCTQLAHDFTRLPIANLTESLEEALVMAEVLEQVYQQYLDVPREAQRFRRDQALYRELLSKKRVPLPGNEPLKTPPLLVGQTIRDITPQANISRLFLTRTRRMMLFIAPLINDLGDYQNWLDQIDTVARPILNYAAWLFFIPRTFTNLYLTAQHVIPGDWMKDAEKALGWQTRLRAQMAIRQFELANDLASLTCNLLNCFLLLGVLSPIGLCVSTALLAYDTGLALCRYAKEIGRLKTLETSYSQMLQKKELPLKERQQIESYLAHFRERRAYEEKRLLVPVVMMSTLLFAFALTLPFMTFCPIIPLVGAAIALLATIASYCVNKWIETQKPVDNLSAVVPKNPCVATQGFFKPKTVQTPSETKEAQAIPGMTWLGGAV